MCSFTGLQGIKCIACHTLKQLRFFSLIIALFFICYCCCSFLPQLNFIGVTVDPDSFYVHFANTRHLFEPVPVGGTSPPVQVYELYNGGARVVKYELDMEPLAQVQAVSMLISLLCF